MKTKLHNQKLIKKQLFLSGLLLFALLSAGRGFAQTVRYAKPVATGTGNGSSWANASADIQLLISKSATNDVIWVAAGTYKPVRPANDSTLVTPTDRHNAFSLTKGVKVYGGFTGTETLLSQRNFTDNATILSGDLNGDDTYDGDGFLTAGYADNAYHVVVAAGNVGEALLDGFTVTGGNADDTGTVTVNYNSVTLNQGAGIVCAVWDTGQRFENLAVKGNRAESGGGIYTTNSSAYFAESTIEANSANTIGGGIYVNSGAPIIVINKILNNTAGSDGGGIYISSSNNSRLANCYIVGNSAVQNGGGMYSVSSNAIAANLLIASNTSDNGAGIYYTSGGTGLVNATITNNTAATSGGGMFMSSATLDLKNSIIWGNTAPANPTADASNGSINLYHTTVSLATLPNEGETSLGFHNVTGNNNVDPQLLSASNYQLSPASPAIDTGNNTYYDAGQTPDVSSITTDLNGNNRIDGTVDRGPYELAAPCGAATIWDGAAWSNGTPVDDTFSAFIDGDYNSATDGEITACSLAVYSGDVVVADGDNFTISNAVEVNGGTLTLEDNANLVQINDADNSGAISVVKKSSALQYLDYTLWSSPVNGSQTLKQFSPGTLDARFYVYNTALDAYSNYTSASGIFGGTPDTVTFTTGKGYLIRMPDGLPNPGTSVFTGTFTGEPNNGDIPMSLATTGTGYNAVGNPYPSPINVQDFISANSTNIDGTLYFWRKTNNPATTSYSTVTSTLFVANSTDTNSAAVFSSTAPANWVINPGQGFFVQATGTVLNFTNSMRRAVNNGQFFKQPVAADDEEVLSALWLNIANTEGAFAQTALAYASNGTTGLDYGLDGKLLGDGAIALYTIAEETPLIIQTKPAFTAADVVPLAFKVGTAGSYTIALDHVVGVLEPSTLDIFLTDTANGNIQNLKNGSYTFTADAGTFDSRFTVTYNDTALGLNNPQSNENGIAVFKKEGSLYINSTGSNLKSVDIFDLQGRKVFSQADINNTQNIISRPLPQGQLLIVKVTTQDNAVTDRKIIN